ncbi:hypothetical protein Dda_3106 [Drechslerella dactyloides]|uniref:Pre-rRNA-processing protein PNO1 n=1 Tax=Drechslerella dactyloides TaxID=74499 RepID=A0AAD6NKY3_DREDA|nr:hypothetical protein Dda_3106 [Drechslerella dactyloides]
MPLLGNLDTIDIVGSTKLPSRLPALTTVTPAVFPAATSSTKLEIMPAPTALIKPVEEPAPEPQWAEGNFSNFTAPLRKTKPLTPILDGAEDIVLDSQTLSTAVESAENPVHEDTEMRIDEEGRPVFQPARQNALIHKAETRKVTVPPHRFSPLKAAWPKIYQPLVEHLKIDVRMNLKTRSVEMRTSKKTEDPGALQKAADFVKVFTLGFDIDDAIALLRLDELYTETFEIKDVKTLQGEHLSRAIGRIAGKDGKTKFAIENATKTRIVLADSKIHILGAFQNIRMAREAVVSLILGAPPGKVYGSLRTVAARQKERF